MMCTAWTTRYDVTASCIWAWYGRGAEGVQVPIVLTFGHLHARGTKKGRPSDGGMAYLEAHLTQGDECEDPVDARHRVRRRRGDARPGRQRLSVGAGSHGADPPGRPDVHRRFAVHRE